MDKLFKCKEKNQGTIYIHALEDEETPKNTENPEAIKRILI